MAQSHLITHSTEFIFSHESMLPGDLVKDFIYCKNCNILQVNIQSFADKFNQLLMLSKIGINFLCTMITETWLSEFAFLPQYFIPGYVFFVVLELLLEAEVFVSMSS